MKCLFCENEFSELIKKSHIIPDWMYKEMFDEKHRIKSYKTLTQVVSQPFTGEYASFLCQGCETEFAKDDDYASQVLKGTSKGIVVTPLPGNSLAGFSAESRLGFDFKNFQKFVLGVIIRNHLSPRANPKNFIPSEIFKNIKRIYLNSNNVDDWAIPIFLFRLTNQKHLWPVMLPFLGPDGKNDVCLFAGAGFVFFTCLTDNYQKRFLNNFRVKSNGYMNLMCGPFEETELFKKSFQAISEMENKQKE